MRKLVKPSKKKETKKIVYAYSEAAYGNHCGNGCGLNW